MKETVLYYYPEATEEVRLAKTVCAILGVRIRKIEKEQLGEKVGGLAGIMEKTEEVEKEAPLVDIGDSIMVFCGFSEKRLDMLLMRLSKAGVSRKGYKAILTPSNAAWSFQALYEELKKEREAILAQKKTDLSKEK